jgi:hypothetical protein
MNDGKNLLTRRTLLLQAFASIEAVLLHAGDQTSPMFRRSGTERDRFCIRALDRKYDLHREKGCTLLAIEVERDQSPDPRRVTFLKRGLRTERTVVPSKGFPSAIMPEAAHHPLFIAENFEGTASVGIAARNFERLFNNNDPILRCLHSESVAIGQLEAGATAHQDSVIIFYKGDHRAILDHFTARIASTWPPS